jgi:hypothetical protein
LQTGANIFFFILCYYGYGKGNLFQKFLLRKNFY